MATAVFDTLKLAQALRDQAKFTPEQAEGAANAIAEAMSSDIATKRDLDIVEANIRRAIAEIELKTAKLIGETNQNISASKTDILKWALGSVGFQTVIIIGAVIALAHSR